MGVPLCAMLVVQPQPQQNNLMHFQESAMYMSPEPANPNQHNNQHNYASNPRANQQWQPTRSNQICRYWSQKGIVRTLTLIPHGTHRDTQNICPLNSNLVKAP